MIQVVYGSKGNYRVTSLKNYNSYIQDSKKIIDCSEFDSFEEIVDYLCKYTRATIHDFINCTN